MTNLKSNLCDFSGACFSTATAAGNNAGQHHKKGYLNPFL